MEVALEVTEKFRLFHSFNPDDVHPHLSLHSYTRRFSTAIDIELCNDWVLRYSGLMSGEFEKIYGFKVELTKPSVDTIPNLMVDILSPQCTVQPGQSVAALALTRAVEAVNLQIDWINKRVQTKPCLGYHEFNFPKVISTYCEYLLDQGLRLDNYMLHLQQQFANNKELSSTDFIIKLPASCLYLFGRFVVANYSDKYIVLPLYVVSLIVSKSIELGACLLSISQARRSDSDLYIRNVYRFLLWMQAVIREYGNDGHTLLKALDGLGHGILTADVDDSRSDYLLNNIRNDLVSQGFSRAKVQEGIEILRSLHPFDIPNITGLAKIYGYPTINTPKGLEKLYKRTHATIDISDEAVRRVINMAKLLFLAHFWRRHKKYPKLFLSVSASKPLVRALLSGSSFLSPEYTAKYGKVNPGDFDGVELSPCVPFDWFDRFYPLLKDKAAAPRRSLIQQAFEAEDVPFPGSRRVLLSYIRNPNPTQEWRVFRRKFEINPRLVQEEFVIKLTTKEKELKLEGRMFGQSPIYERQRRIVGEANIAALMELYNSDQCMLVNEHEKRKKMAFLSRASAYTKDAYTIIIGVDAEAWNNYFRAKLVNQFGREFFDKIFGIEFYEHTMDVFNQSIIYHRDAADNITSWNGQEGGIEGLAQKVWTWIYTVIARLVLHMTELDGFMMVNGDDMRIVLIVPKAKVDGDEQKLAEFQKDLLEKLRDLFRIYGIVMKIDETNITRSLLCFGRNYVLSGIALPGDIKKIIKAGGLTDVGFPSITDVIGSISSNAHSACGLSYQVIPNVVFAYTMILLYLHWHRFISLTPTTRSTIPHPRTEETTMILTTPNAIGGLDTMLLYQYILQGESDVLPLFFDWLVFLWHEHSSFRHVIRRVLEIQPDPTLPRSLLLTDIYSLPLKRPKRPNAIVRARVRRFLLRRTRNAELLKLLQFDQTENRRVVNALWSMQPFNPRIASYLMSISPFAIVDSIIQKFDSAQTLAHILFRNDRQRNFRFFTLIIQVDRRLIGSTIRRVIQGGQPGPQSLTHIIPLIENRVCATSIAIYLRQKLWKKEDMVDSTIPSVLQQLCITEEQTFDPSLQTFQLTSPQIDHFTARTGRLQSTSTMYGPLSRLMCAPYFAHTTGLRLGSRLTELKGSEPTIMMIRKLTDAQALLSDQGQDILAWSAWCSLCMFGEEIENVCPTTVKKLGGTVGHRLPAWSFQRTVYLNTLPSRTGRSKANLDTLGNRGSLFSKNRTHNYSAMTCWFQYHCTADMENDLLSQGQDSIKWAVMVACRDISGDPSLCSCHNEVSGGNYEMDPPPIGLVEKLERFISQSALMRMSEESETALLEYKRRFQEMWFGTYKYDAWLSEEPSEQKYFVASSTASMIICSELESSVHPYSGGTQLDDSLMFNETIGKISTMSQFSIRDFAVLNMDHLAEALIRTCLGVIIDSIIPPTMYSFNEWVRLLLPPGSFFTLCQSLYIAKATGRFLVGINNTLDKYRVPGIPLSYDLLVSPLLVARSLSRAMVTFARDFMISGCPLPASHLIYLAGQETDLTVRRSFLTQIWRVIVIAIIKGSSIHDLPAPSKSAAISHMLGKFKRSYLAACFMMTVAFMETGDTLCPGLTREVVIDASTWLLKRPSVIITWDPLQEYINTDTLPLNVFEQLIDDIETIVANSFLANLDLHLMLIRLPYQVCIEACMEWINLGVTEVPVLPSDARIVMIQPPNDSISFSALPLESDLLLSQLVLPEFPFEPIPRGDREIWNPACYNRYYQLSTSALNKYLECLLTVTNFKYVRKQKLLLLATADGAGGVSVLLTRLFPNSRVIFNTLENDLASRASLIDCPDSSFLQLEETNRLVCNHNASGVNDLSDPLIVARFEDIAKSEGSYFWLITCDAEAPDLEESLTNQLLTFNLIRIINNLGIDGGMCILKRFISPARHQLMLYMYLCSAYTHVKIFKPCTSHKSSGEIFFIGYNKERSWSSQRIEEFLKEPTATYETVRSYFASMEQLALYRKLNKDATPLKQVMGIGIPHPYQRMLVEWRISRQHILSSCSMIPRMWIGGGQGFNVGEHEVESAILRHLDYYPNRLSNLSKVMKKAYMMSLGAMVIILEYLKNGSIETCEERRVPMEEQLVTLGGDIQPETMKMHIRHFRYGGRIALSYIGANNRSILEPDTYQFAQDQSSDEDID
nr:TPA_asm: polymerase [Orientalis fluke virus]